MSGTFSKGYTDGYFRWESNRNNNIAVNLIYVQND